MTFEYAPSQESGLLKLALVAERKHLEELKRLRAAKEQLDAELEQAMRHWSSDSD